MTNNCNCITTITTNQPQTVPVLNIFICISIYKNVIYIYIYIYIYIHTYIYIYVLLLHIIIIIIYYYILLFIIIIIIIIIICIYKGLTFGVGHLGPFVERELARAVRDVELGEEDVDHLDRRRHTVHMITVN